MFEAFSKLVSRALVPENVLRKMLDALVTACDMEKSFLFDVASKVYVATDSAPVDSASYELCADAIDVVLDVASIYAPDKTQQPEPSEEERLSERRSRSRRGRTPRPYNCRTAWLRGCWMKSTGTWRWSVSCRTENLEKRDLIDYNLGCFRTALGRLAALNASSAGKQAVSIASATAAWLLFRPATEDVEACRCLVSYRPLASSRSRAKATPVLRRRCANSKFDYSTPSPRWRCGCPRSDSSGARHQLDSQDT